MHHQAQPAIADPSDRYAHSLLAEMLCAVMCSTRDLSFLTEAHDSIAERAGFKGLPESSASIAALSPTVMPRKLRGAQSLT